MDIDDDDVLKQDVGVLAPILPPPRVPTPPAAVRASSEPFRPPPYTVGYVYAVDMMIHACINGHPEDPERILRIMQAIQATGMDKQMRRLPIRQVRREEALLVHSESHWDKIIAIQSKCLIGREYYKCAAIFSLSK